MGAGEYELFRLMDNALAESLLWQYLQRAPVAESFIWRRWLYVLWDEVAQLVNTGRFNRSNFDWQRNHCCRGSPEPLATARCAPTFRNQHDRYALARQAKELLAPRVEW